MRNYLFIIFLLWFSKQHFGQLTGFPKGAYFSFDNLNKRIPSVQTNFRVTKRTKSDIYMQRGNDYIINQTNDSISSKDISKKYLAISNGDSLFINGKVVGLEQFYCLAIKQGKYIVFLGSFPKEITSPLITQAHADSLKFGDQFMGGAGANKRRFYYAINKDKIRTLNKDAIIEYTKEFPQIQSDFLKETKFDGPTLLKYIDRLNTAN